MYKKKKDHVLNKKNGESWEDILKSRMMQIKTKRKGGNASARKTINSKTRTKELNKNEENVKTL